MADISVALKHQVGEGRVLVNEPMDKHTSFRTGGNVDYLIKPQTIEQLISAIRLCRQYEIPYEIMGNCSNVLIGDGGLPGAVIQIFSNMCHVKIEGDIIESKAGALLTVVATKAMDNGLKGFEFASGIPGTIGGAVTMNAGAYDGEMKQRLISVTALTPELEVKTIAAKDLHLGYRTSIVKEQELILLSARLQLEPGNKEEIKGRMTELAALRREKQPLQFPSAGSTFKRPEGYFAGKLIADAGLKGYCIGGAAVSEKHAGFIINQGGATSQDILALIRHCQRVVFEKFGVKLETEVKILGNFENTNSDKTE